ncbi:MAG: PEGA domain-containing protein [Polyangiaceae bacterium]
MSNRSTSRARSSVGLLVLALMSATRLSALAAPSEPSAADKADAMKKYDEGSQAFADKRYKDAIDLFLEADAIVHNADLAYNASLAYEAMGDQAAALRWAREYLRRAPDAEDRKAVLARIDKFEAHLQSKGVQQLTVLSTPDGGTVFVDGRAVGVTPWTGELRPGAHEIVVRLSAYQDASQTFELRPERSGELTLTLQPAPTTQEPAPTPKDAPPPITHTAPAPSGPSIPLLGAGIAVAIAGLGGLGASLGLELLRASAEDDARAAPVQTDARAALDSMEGYQLGARIAVGAGAGLVAIGATLLGVSFAVTPQSSDTKTAVLALDCPVMFLDDTNCVVSVRGVFQ